MTTPRTAPALLKRREPSLFKMPTSALPLPERALLIPTIDLARRYYSTTKPNKPKFGLRLFGTVDLTIVDGVAFLSPTFTAPVAALTIEYLAAQNVKQLFFLGVAGALALNERNYHIGDIVFPRGAISESGITELYRLPNIYTDSPAPAQLRFEESLRQTICQTTEITIHHGAIWSTDAPCLESWDKASEYKARGAVAVDMEYAVILGMANYFELELCALFVISDLLDSTPQSGFRSKQFNNTLDLICRWFPKLFAEES